MRRFLWLVAMGFVAAMTVGASAVEIDDNVPRDGTPVEMQRVFLPLAQAMVTEITRVADELTYRTAGGVAPSSAAAPAVSTGTPGDAAKKPPRDGDALLGLGAFNIVIEPGSALAANPAALGAFNRAAQLWAARISDPITVTINADMANLGSGGIIGSASTVILQTGYAAFRDQMVLDASDEADDAVVLAAPNASQFSAYVPAGFTLSGYMAGSKANFKAMGVTGLDEQFGAADGRIRFNTQFAFDFDNSDGVSAGMVDFESVAAHELGHVLGFISTVDGVDVQMNAGTTGAVSPYALDTFRFNNGTDDPETLAEFTATDRNLSPGGTRNTDQINAWGTLAEAELRMSTGRYTGDGRQASHWKDDSLLGFRIGIMDPSIGYGVITVPLESDYRALDLIGYDIAAIPEPISLVFVLVLGLAGLLLGIRRVRRAGP